MLDFFCVAVLFTVIYQKFVIFDKIMIIINNDFMPVNILYIFRKQIII